MKVTLDISQNTLEQFRTAFAAPAGSGTRSLEMAPEVGEGRMDLIEFPNRLEFYHYTSTLKQRLELTSTNPASSEWFGLNINLGDTELIRRVGGSEVTLQRLLPSGILVYPPDSRIEGVNEPHRFSESVFIRFHREFLGEYSESSFDALRPPNGVVLFEHLDYQSEMLLRETIRLQTDKLAAHTNVLGFMRRFLQKVEARELESGAERLHAEDLRGLFRASAALRNPVLEDVPSIQELADLANMGATKFKTSFRAVFGVAPLRYHHKVKMDYARDELMAGRKAPSELAYELGYSHPSKFTAAFKKQFDQLPSRVRGEPFRP